MSAVVTDGVSSTRSVGALPDGRLTLHGTAVTDTARLLALPPLPPPRTALIGWVIGVAHCTPCAVVAVLAGGRGSATGDDAVVISMVFGVLGLTVLVVLVSFLISLSTADRQRRRIARYVAQLHSHAWYCGRCGGAFFRPGTVPPQVPTDTLMPVHRFGTFLWAHGRQQWRMAQHDR